MEKQKSHEKGKEIVLWLSSERGSKRRRRESDIEIPNDDVFEEILVRLPVESLLRFQIVSKHWRHTIKSRSFMERHLLHQKTQEPKFLCLNEDKRWYKPNISLKTMKLEWCSTCLIEEGPTHRIETDMGKNNVSILGSCDGLVCMFDADNLATPIIVINPAMGRSQILPLSRFQQQNLVRWRKVRPNMLSYPGFGKDNVTGTYKLVWLHNKRNKWSKTSVWEIFDFEVKEWRYVIYTPYELLPNKEPVFAKGWLYWLTHDQRILAYNLHTEMFRVITNTIISKASCPQAISMVSLSDRLWITDMERGNGIQHFWRVKNALELKWESEKMFSLEFNLISSLFPDEGSWSPITLMVTSKDNKKVLISELYSSKFIQMLPHPTSLVFHSVIYGPYDSELIPYFQSLDFPL